LGVWGAHGGANIKSFGRRKVGWMSVMGKRENLRKGLGCRKTKPAQRPNRNFCRPSIPKKRGKVAPWGKGGWETTQGGFEGETTTKKNASKEKAGEQLKWAEFGGGGQPESNDETEGRPERVTTAMRGHPLKRQTSSE